jgi:plasmid stability protein
MTAMCMHNAVITTMERQMAVLTIRNVPEELYERLRTAAETRNRSINGEAIECLRFALAPRANRDTGVLVARARAIHERMRGAYLTAAEIKRAKGAGRE